MKKNELLSHQEVIAIRRELHKSPELSFQEEKTAERIANLLHSYGATKIMRNLGGHGVLAEFNGAIPGPIILLRAELDALPILEENKQKYASAFPGISHACGHDGHMAILLGVAQALAKKPLGKGKIVFLFQSAEETGEGAQAILADKKWKNINPDFVFALHNLPGIKKHSILVKNGNFTASVKSLIIRLKGKTSHAGEPENGANPAWAIAEILQLARTLSNHNKADKEFMLITPIHINLGEKAYGVAAGYGELHFTIRSWDESIMENKSNQLLDKVHEISFLHNLSVNMKWIQEFKASINDPKAVDIIREAANSEGLILEERKDPFSWGEDFGLFTQKYSGAMFVLGAGKNSPALHNPDYDFPDELLESGIKMFNAIIHHLLN